MSSYGTFVAPMSVQFSRLLPGPIERVWAFIAEPEKRAKWFAGGAMDLRPGGTIEFQFDHRKLSPAYAPAPEKYKEMENGMTMPGLVLEVDAPHKVVFQWGADATDYVTFALAPEGEQVRLTVTHEKLKSRGGLLSVSSGWHAHLDVLEAVLTDQTPGPIWPAFERLESEYDAMIPA